MIGESIVGLNHNSIQRRMNTHYKIQLSPLRLEMKKSSPSPWSWTGFYIKKLMFCISFVSFNGHIHSYKGSARWSPGKKKGLHRGPEILKMHWLK